MKLKILWSGIVMLLLFSCNNQGNVTKESNVIDVEHGMENLTRLKTSDFGQKIRYIPLETTDEGLVGGNPVVKVFKKYIVVEAQKSCLLFDKSDGRFIAKIGHVGQDPAAYSGEFSWMDEKEEFLYFHHQPNQLVKYDTEGNFCGKVKFSAPGLASYYLITDSGFIGHFGGMNTATQCVLGFFDRDGLLKDSIPALISNHQVVPDDIAGISVLRGKTSYPLYGNWTASGAILIDYKNDTKQIIVPNAAKLWRNGENIRFKPDFVDTLYTVSGNKLIPSIAFNTGKYHLSVEESMDKENSVGRIFIAEVSENRDFVFFQCIRGLNSKDPVLYNGLYDKRTGETKLAKNSDRIEDDLTHFLPFTPLGISTTGEFVSLVEMIDVTEWLEKHPEAADNENLSFLQTLDEEMNPIVMLVE